MNPYYEHGGIAIYHCDFREGLDLFADCNLVVADPPYNETSLPWDKWPVGWPSVIGLNTPLAASLWCFGSARMFFDRSTEFVNWRLVQDVVWEKQNGSGFINDRFKRVHEFAYQFVRKAAKWTDVYKCPQFTKDAASRTIRRKTPPPHMNHTGEHVFTSVDGGPRLQRSVIYAKNCHGNADNETQKPVELVGSIVRYSCPPGGLIVSPFMGSGTDLVVAKAHGMRAIGFELREQQCEAAARRLAQDNLFAGVTDG